MKRLVMDIDNTISETINGDYSNSAVLDIVAEKVRKYKMAGFQIVFFTSRNMNTYEGNVGKINAYTLPILVDWLNKHDIPYDEVHVGKPWCGEEGFYVDDKAIRPAEFVNLEYSEVVELLKNNKIEK